MNAPLPRLAACCSTWLFAAALAAQDDRALLESAFARLDADKDGVVVRREFPGSDRQFAAMDQDKDGKVPFAEYAASPVAKTYLRSRQREKEEPRPRTSLDAIALARLELLGRSDRNRDGKVVREEWNGTDEAFRQLDLDGNGVLDKRDLKEAEGMAPPERKEPPLPDDLPAVEELLRRFDKDKDGKLAPKELGSLKGLAAVLEFFDGDRDGALSERELQALRYEIERRREEADRLGRRALPYEVPFDTWDADKDGKIQQNEWQGPRNLFDRMDLDRDAAVSRDEVRRYERRMKGDDFIGSYDLNGDGKVTLAEFGGPPAAFARADRNGDGVVNRADK